LIKKLNQNLFPKIIIYYILTEIVHVGPEYPNEHRQT